MRIGELAKQAGLSRDTIRFYEREGLIASCAGDSQTNNYREYSPESLERLRFIVEAREAGLSISDLKQLYSALDGACGTEAARAIVQDKIAELERSIASSKNMVGFLEQMLLGLDRGCPGD